MAACPGLEVAGAVATCASVMMGITHPQDDTTAADPQDAGAGATHATTTTIHATAKMCIACPQVDTITTAFQAVGAVAPCVTTYRANTRRSDRRVFAR